jgi:hypothetical protein
MRAPIAIALLASALAGTAAMAQTPYELRDLVRAQVGGGEDQLGRRGWRAVRETSPSAGEEIVYWEKGGRCLAVTISRGRFAALDAARSQYCDGGPTPRTTDRMRDYGAGNADTRRDRRSGYDDRQADRIYNRGASLFLLCYGDGRNPDVRARYGVDNRDRSGARDRDAEVQVEVWGSRGRIRLEDGEWRDLENIRETRDRITGRFNAGFGNTRLDIDRRLGKIRIDGARPFRGNCDLGETTGQRRRY